MQRTCWRPYNQEVQPATDFAPVPRFRDGDFSWLATRSFSTLGYINFAFSVVLWTAGVALAYTLDLRSMGRIFLLAFAALGMVPLVFPSNWIAIRLARDGLQIRAWRSLRVIAWSELSEVRILENRRVLFRRKDGRALRVRFVDADEISQRAVRVFQAYRAIPPLDLPSREGAFRDIGIDALSLDRLEEIALNPKTDTALRQAAVNELDGRMGSEAALLRVKNECALINLNPKGRLEALLNGSA